MVRNHLTKLSRIIEVRYVRRIDYTYIPWSDNKDSSITLKHRN